MILTNINIIPQFLIKLVESKLRMWTHLWETWQIIAEKGLFSKYIFDLYLRKQ